MQHLIKINEHRAGHAFTQDATPEYLVNFAGDLHRLGDSGWCLRMCNSVTVMRSTCCNKQTGNANINIFHVKHLISWMCADSNSNHNRGTRL